MPQPLVVLVDDDVRTHPLFTNILKPLSAEVVCFVSTQALFALMQQRLPDLIIMDLHLPPPSAKGWDAIAEIKSRAATRHITCLALSAGSSESMQRAAVAGSDGFLTKPVDVADVRQRIAAILSAV